MIQICVFRNAFCALFLGFRFFQQFSPHHFCNFLSHLDFPFFSFCTSFFSSFSLSFFLCLPISLFTSFFFLHNVQVYSAVETVICIPIRDYERTGPSGFLTSVVILKIMKYSFFSNVFSLFLKISLIVMVSESIFHRRTQPQTFYFFFDLYYSFFLPHLFLSSDLHMYEHFRFVLYQ